MTKPAVRPIVILGPTAGGKSELAVRLAQRCGGEIISADSMQIYRHMDAGTAKPTADQRSRVPHHLIDIVEPTERFTVADWLCRADSVITELQGRGIRPIIVGGTNLYLKALLEGMFDGPAGDPGVRTDLTSLPTSELHRRLRDVDPVSAARIHPNDQRRLVRALEVHQMTGRPISQWQTQWDSPACSVPSPDRGSHGRYRHDPILIGLRWPVEAINRRINLRVKAMFYPDKVSPALAAQMFPNAESLPQEAGRLESAGRLGPQAREALGYKQILEHMAGHSSLEEAFEKTKVLTRRFAKTQRTWLKRFDSVFWLEACRLSAEQMEAEVAENIGL